MVIDLESKRPVKTQMTPMRGSARPTLVRVIDSEFIDDVPKKRSEAAEPIKDVEDINKVSRYLVDSQRYRDNLLFICGITVSPLDISISLMEITTCTQNQLSYIFH